MIIRLQATDRIGNFIIKTFCPSEANAFHERVRNGFLSQAKASAHNWLVLNAANTQDELFLQLVTELKGRKWI